MVGVTAVCSSLPMAFIRSMSNPAGLWEPSENPGASSETPTMMVESVIFGGGVFGSVHATNVRPTMSTANPGRTVPKLPIWPPDALTVGECRAGYADVHGAVRIVACVVDQQLEVYVAGMAGQVDRERFPGYRPPGRARVAGHPWGDFQFGVGCAAPAVGVVIGGLEDDDDPTAGRGDVHVEVGDRARQRRHVPVEADLCGHVDGPVALVHGPGEPTGGGHHVDREEGHHPAYRDPAADPRQADLLEDGPDRG